MYKNYQMKSTEALSVSFLAEWAFGDTLNLTGSILSHQMFTQILQALYFVMIDCLWVIQFTYYNFIYPKRTSPSRIVLKTVKKKRPSYGSPTSPLLDDDEQSNLAVYDALNSSIEDEECGLPANFSIQHQSAPSGSVISMLYPAEENTSTRQRSSSGSLTVRRASHSKPVHDRELEVVPIEAPPRNRRITHPTPSGTHYLNVMGVWIVFILFLSMTSAYQILPFSSEQWSTMGRVLLHHHPGFKSEKTIGEVIGFLSASFYICARVPQIRKNYHRKSVEGLSIYLFICAVCGNLFYGFSILCWSDDWPFIRSKFPWLLGSLGTLCFDFTIFLQFMWYAETGKGK